MTPEFLEAFIETRMRQRGLEWHSLHMLSIWPDPHTSNILVRLGSEDGDERVILQKYMTDLETARVLDGALLKLFPPPSLPVEMPRRKRLAGRRGPLSPRHWTGA